MPTVTYLSDIHLEFEPFVSDLNGGDILCLAGDIGYPESEQYFKFLANVASKFKFVFVVAGNHEYYQTSSHPNKTIQTTNETIARLCKHFCNVHFLSESSINISEFNLNVLGTTLWTGGETNREEMFQYNDFQKIHNMAQKGTMQRQHEKSILFLKDELQKHKHDGSKVIVLTHHLPSFQLIAPQYKNYGLNHLFATNLDDLFREYTIHHWICGHSHCPVQKTIQNTKVWMNPVGYPEENKNVCWNATFEL